MDVLCAEFGGIRTYVEQVTGQWGRVFPEDEVHVFLRSGSTLDTPGLHRHELHVRRPDVVGRPWVQTTTMRSTIRALRPDVVLATAPTTSVLPFGAPLVVTILDLRAELRPHQFSGARRLLRAVSYRRTYRLADGFVSISHRSLDDLHRLHPTCRTKPGVVAHLGADHVRSWPTARREGPAIAFAHHTNKRPELAVGAWARLRRDGVDVPDLLLLGVSPALREELDALIGRLGVQDSVRLAPFLPEDEFRRRISEAPLIVFPSDFEGFGLPVVEGMALGVPVVIGPDAGLLEVAGGHAIVMDGWSVDALADAVVETLDLSQGDLDAARDWAETFAWERTIRQTRAALAGVAAAHTRNPQ